MDAPTITQSPRSDKDPSANNAAEPLQRYLSKISADSVSQKSISDFFHHDKDISEASRKIRRLLYRRRAREIENWSYPRKFLHIMFYEPASRRAHIYMAFSTMVLLLFLIVFMLNTMPQYRVKPHWPRFSENINLGTAIYFGVEWLMRFYAYPHPKRYIFEPMSLIDLLSVVPAYATYDPSLGISFGRAKWLRALQILRILRIMRIAEYSVELYVIVRTLKKSLTQILIVMLVITIVMLTACFLMFFSENDYLDVASGQWMRKNRGVVEVSPFQNVFYCLYWGFVTVTTVGYGDLTPVSPWGQVVACLTMVMGVFTVVFPTSIISTNFANEWAAFHKAQKLHQRALLQRETENRRLQLARIWNDANRDYDADPDASLEETPTAGGSVGLAEGGHKEATKSKPELNEKTEPGDRQPDMSNMGLPRATRIDFSQTTIGEPSAEPPHFTRRQQKMAPFEYEEMIHVVNKVEKDLGIPKMDMNEIEEGGAVNQKLLINAMHSKLYNDAYSMLCERLLFCLSEFRRFYSTEDLADYLQNLDTTHGHLTNNPPISRKQKMTTLEYKLMSFVYEKVSLRLSAGTARMSPHNTSNQPTNQRHQMIQQQELGEHFTYSSPDVMHSPDADSSGGGVRKRLNRSRRNLARKVKSRLRYSSSFLPLSRHDTNQTAHQSVASSYSQQNRLSLRRPTHNASPAMSRVMSEMQFDDLSLIREIGGNRSAVPVEEMQSRQPRPSGQQSSSQKDALNPVAEVAPGSKNQERSSQVAIDIPPNDDDDDDDDDDGSSSDTSSSSGESESREALSIRRRTLQNRDEAQDHDADDEYHTSHISL